MSEVKRYLIQKTPIGTMMKPNPEGNWVESEDFDRVTAERDAALGREVALREEMAALKHPMNSAVQVRAERDALQQLLDAADERRDLLEAVSVKQAALLEELGLSIDEVDDLFGETLKNAKRYEYLRSVMTVEDFPDPHPKWSQPSEAESKRIDALCDAALNPADGGIDAPAVTRTTDLKG